MSAVSEPAGRFLRVTLAGSAATLAGIGLARFAYVPLFPAMVKAGWVDPAGAGMVGAANLAGYLGGALVGRSAARRLGTARTLDCGMALAAAAFAACAWEGGLLYLALWRAVAGVAGGILMALAGPAVQGAVAAARRGQAGGIVVSGVGSGAVLASLLVPVGLGFGVGSTWLGLAAAVVLLWLLARPAWPDTPIAPAIAGGRSPGTARLLVAYALSGAGMVAHMVYLSDLAVRGRGMSAAAGAVVWLLFGLGAIGGTLAGGRVADRRGAGPTLRVWLGLQVAAVVAALTPWPGALLLAGALGGFTGVGLSAVGLARARELAGARSSGLWGAATACYAAAQAVTAFGLAALFARTGSHDLLFALCLGLSAAGLAVALWPGGERAASA